MTPREPEEPGSGLGDEPVVEIRPEEAERLLDEAYGAPPAGTSPAGGDGTESADGSRELLVGTDAPSVPGYEILSVIGRGATGVVYRARQEAVDRPVALKVLHEELITNRRAVRRLKREARLAAQLAHPSIISAIDMGVVDGLWWYAMELVEGVSLARRIAERGSLTERECLRLFSPLCDALQHAHEVGVVHRDIKPANILIDGRGRARLVDLGLAMGQNDPSITKTGSTLGTPHYVSPEQAREPSAADIRSDLWSVGATMYHAVCGRPPFAAEEEGGVAEILSRVLYMPVVDPREYAPDLSRGFALLLRKCLTRDPDQRYQEPWELVADIELLRERRRLDLRGARVDAFASRRPGWLPRALAAGALIAAVGGTWALTARPWEDRGQPGVAGPSLADWPALDDLRQEFEAGRVRHRSALAELQTIGAGLPDEARFFANQLETEIKRSLRGEVDAVLAGVGDQVRAALVVHSFEGAQRLADEGVALELRARTGYETVEQLPEGQLRTEATSFVDVERTRVEDAHGDARAEAVRALDRAWSEAFVPRVDRFVDAGSFRSALEWLEGPADWIERAGERVDVRGLDDEERAEIAASLDRAVRDARARVAAASQAAYRGALRQVAELEREADDEIGDGRLTGSGSVAGRLEEKLFALETGGSFQPDELIEDYPDFYRERVDTLLDSVRRREVDERDALARRDLARLEREAERALDARDYGHAAALFEAARQDPWRACTHGEIDAWTEELALLLRVREELARRLAEGAGRSIGLTFDGIGSVGRLEAAGNGAFRLVARGGSTKRVRVWRPVDETPDPRERVLATADVRPVLEGDAWTDARSAGPGDEVEPWLRLGVAALLAAEGSGDEALRMLPLGGTLPERSMLEERIRRRVQGEAPGKAPRGPISSEPGSNGDASVGTGARRGPPLRRPADSGDPLQRIGELYGTPNQVTSGRDVRLAWNFREGFVPPGGDDGRGFELLRPAPSGAARAGAWRLGSWRLAYGGITLDDPLGRAADVFDVARCPYLLLEEGLELPRGVRARLWLEPGEEGAGGHVVCVSLAGYHVLLAEGHVWLGGGAVGDLVELFELIEGGYYESTDAFEVRSAPRVVPGETLLVDLEVRRGSRVRLVVDGRSVGFAPLRRPPSLRDPVLRVRSREPIALLAAELEAHRAGPR